MNYFNLYNIDSMLDYSLEYISDYITNLLGMILLIIIGSLFIVRLIKSINCTIRYAKFKTSETNFAIPATFSFIKNRRLESENIKRLEKGILAVQDLLDLTNKEFQYWCGELLQTLGYSNVIQSENSDEGIDIICKYKEDPVYVECRKLDSLKSSINSSVCKEVIGTMLVNGIKKGIIITTGKISEDAVKYANSLYDGLELKLMDGNDIINYYNLTYNKV